MLGYQKRGKFREVGKKQDNHHAHLTVKFPTSFLKFCSKIHIHRFFQLAIVKLYRMLDQAEVIIISESQMCMFIKRAAEVEIQKTQCGTVQKVINMFELLLLATISFSTNM